MEGCCNEAVLPEFGRAWGAAGHVDAATLRRTWRMTPPGPRAGAHGQASVNAMIGLGRWSAACAAAPIAHSQVLGFEHCRWRLPKRFTERLRAEARPPGRHAGLRRRSAPNNGGTGWTTPSTTAGRQLSAAHGPAGHRKDASGPDDCGEAARAEQVGAPGVKTHCSAQNLRPLFLEGVSQMDSILPERLLALVRPGNDLVLRRIRKRCVQACGCKIMTPRYACNLAPGCISSEPTFAGLRQNKKKKTRGPKKRGPRKKGKRGFLWQSLTSLEMQPGAKLRRICSHTPARSVLDFESFGTDEC